MELRIRLNVETPTLYELSFFALDLLRLNVISTYVDEAQDSTIKSKLETVKDFDRLFFNRASLKSFYNEHKESIEVKDFKEGSIELVIAGIGVAASIIVPTVLYYLNKNDNANNQTVNFTVDSQDREMNDFLNSLENRRFGSFDDCFEFIRQTMIRRGYQFEAISDNTYRALKANTNRIEDVLLTTRRIKRN